VFGDLPEELALVWGASALVLICFWGFLRRSFHRRIENLVRATERLAAGEPFNADRNFTPDELARLSAAFERMSQRIARSTGALREANERMRVEITERNSVEAALRNSEQRFRSIWENSLEPLRLTDSKGTVLAANPSYCRMMEQGAEEIQGSPYTEVYQRDRAEEKLARYVDNFLNRSFERHQTKRVTLLSGRTVDVEVSYSFIEMAGDHPLLLAIFRDVT
jgi:PAS domain S-box-containing protein